MTIRHLKIFIAVYKTGSITKAAKQLYLTQPVVSRTIQELERYYGVRLFERINQRLSVTEAGHQFYSYAIHIVDSFDHMESDLRNWDELGVVRVGASVTLGSMLLPQAIKEFQSLRPGITVKASVTNGTRLQYLLENNELDFALIEGCISNENLTAEELCEDRLVLLLPPNSELLTSDDLFLAELLSYPLLLRENESVSRILINRIFALHNLPLTPLMESVSTHAIIQGVHQGLGISFLPERLVQHSIESGFIATRPVTDESFVRKNFIVYHKNKYMSKSSADFIDICRSKALDYNL